MDLPNSLAIIGIIVSVIFGAWGIFVTFRTRSFGEITYFIEHTIALVDSIAGRIPDLSVFYRDQPASINLVLLKGTFVNTGTLDIAPNMVETPVSMQLPDGYSWLHADIVSTSSDVKASASFEDKHIVLKTGLLRPGEFIRMEALATLPEQSAVSNQEESREELLLNNLAFAHRIANVSQIKSRKPPEKPVSSWKWIMSLLPAIIIFCLFSVLGLTILHGVPPVKLVFPYSAPNDSIIFVEAELKNADVVKVKDIDNSVEKELPYEIFSKQLRGSPVIKQIKIKDPVSIKVVGSLFIGLPFIYGLYALYNEINKRRYQIRLFKTYSDDASQ